jgi:hypothetical protein
VEIETSQRSAIKSSKLAAGRMVSTIFRLAGFEVEHVGGYPGWKTETTSWSGATTDGVGVSQQATPPRKRWRSSGESATNWRLMR